MVGLVLGVIAALAMNKNLLGALGTLRGSAERHAVGDLERGLSEKMKDTVRLRGDELAGFGYCFDQLHNYFDEMAKAADRIATGDLTIEIVPKSPTDELGHSFVKIVNSLRELVGKVSAGANQVAGSSEDLNDYAIQASDSTQQIAQTIQQVARGAAVPRPPAGAWLFSGGFSRKWLHLPMRKARDKHLAGTAPRMMGLTSRMDWLTNRIQPAPLPAKVFARGAQERRVGCRSSNKEPGEGDGPCCPDGGYGQGNQRRLMDAYSAGTP
jgi:hypothetical protein